MARKQPDRREYFAKYREDRREELREKNRAYYLKNLDERRECNRISARKRREQRPLPPGSRKEQSRRYYLANKAEILRKCAEYNRQHADTRPAKSKEYAERNREKIIAKRKAHYQAHKEKFKEYHERNFERISKRHREYMKTYYAENADAFQEYRRNRLARERGAAGSHTKKEVADLLIRQGRKCATCKTPISKNGKTAYHLDHVLPISKDGSNDIGNLQLLCVKCNLRKAAKHPDDWAREHGLLFC